MKQQLVLEDECIGCGNLFDLSYDLGTKKELSDEEISELMKKVAKNGNSLLRHLCWQCRQVN